MPLNSDQIRFRIGDAGVVANMANLPARAPFDDALVDYLDAVSRILLHAPAAKAYPDVVTFAFWCRKASVRTLQKNCADLTRRLGRGVAFHIAPSNVAVNFAYSLAAGILTGNANIVRLPSKSFPQVDLLADALADALNEAMQPYICLLQYGHDQTVTDALSALADTRIIWGGDQTIAAIRQSPLQARATEITFADRFSFSVIDADAYLQAENPDSIARDFYNDTFLTDQNACTSPRIVIWLGRRVPEAQAVFWQRLHDLVQAKYALQPVQAVSKYANFCRHAATGCPVHLEPRPDNLIVRVRLDRLDAEAIDHIGHSGYFLEYAARSLDEILPLGVSACQTLSYYGVDARQLQDFVLAARPRGIDRIVPIGKTMDFTLLWDGYDLVRSLTRGIYCL